MAESAAQLLARLSKDAQEIADAIERRQSSLSSSVSRAERDLFLRLIDEVFSDLEFSNGAIVNSIPNYLLLYRIDEVFDAWQTEVMNPLMRGFVQDLIAIADMTGMYYKDFAAEKIVNDIATSNELLRASLGIDARGNMIKGGMISDISKIPSVRQQAKMLFLQELQSGGTLKQLNATVKDFIHGHAKQPGAINANFNSKASGYAYDLFNKVAEIKNEQFRENLDLQYFIYVGGIIHDSRPFCIKKAGKVFAVIEADTEWPGDPDLPGKTSGIPYTPRIDRGRWNCRHRIRYITEELAFKIDPKKVEQIRQSYGVINANQ